MVVIFTVAPVMSAPLPSRTTVVTTSSAQFLFASALSPALPSPLVRVNATPPTVTVVLARTTVVPVTADVIDTVQEPVAPTVVHVFTPPTKEPGPLWMLKVIRVPTGAGT